MSGDTSAFGFGKFIPGFDFLQGLAQSAGSAANPMGRVPQWVAPTVSVEEVDKRIAELKAVQFWLDQNGRALSATIQALEVQRMTLSTLKGMNVSMSELAKSFQFPAGVMPGADAAQAAQAAAGFTGWPMGDSAAKEPQAAPEQQAQAHAQQHAHTPHQPEAAPEPQAEAASAAAEDAAASAQQQTQAAMGQAMQWWGALTQQFQQIAAKAMAEPVPAETMAAAQRATEAASGFAKSAMDKVMAQANAFTPTNEPAAAKQAAAANKPKPAAKKAAPKAAAKTAAKPAAKPAAKKPARKATAAARKS